MKKSVIIFVMCLILINISACSEKRLYIEESKANFEEYGLKTSEISEKHGYHAEKLTREYVLNSEYEIFDYHDDIELEAYRISRDNNEQIFLVFENNCNTDGMNKKGVEYCSLEYTQKTNNKQFNLKLFTELINEFCEEEITVSLCKEFLNEERYVDELSEFENICKDKRSFIMDFYGFYRLEYAQYSEKETLKILCPTKASETHTGKNFMSFWLLGILVIACIGGIVTFTDIRRQKRLKHH